MPSAAYQQFLKDPNQAERRRQLAAFIGSNAMEFLPVYDQMHTQMNRAPGEKKKFFIPRGFCWAAFSAGPVWFFYRKLWLWALGIVVISVVLGLLPVPSGVGIGMAVGLGYAAKQVYVGHAVTTIANMPAMSDELLARTGGVSWLAGWVAGSAYVLAVAFAIYNAVIGLQAQ